MLCARKGTEGSNPSRSAILRPSGFGRQAILDAAGLHGKEAAVWYVYILRCAGDGKIYVGSTNDLKRRLSEHKEGRVAWTRERLPVILEAYSLAPAARRSLAAARALWIAVSCIGVLLFKFLAPASAPYLRRSRATADWFPCAAACSGVVPQWVFRFRASTSAPASRSARAAAG